MLIRIINILKGHFCLYSRRKKYNLFISLLHPKESEKILDIGVDDTEKEDPYTNFFEFLYPFKSSISAVGLTNGEFFKRKFPDIEYIKADGRSLPFKNNQFDIAFSNAVLEHVGEGDYSEQKKFINEILRVSKRGMIATPYKYCLIEPHIFIPFLFYFPKRIRDKIIKKKFKLTWNLLTVREFKNLFPSNLELKIIKQKILCIPINLIAIYKKRL